MSRRSLRSARPAPAELAPVVVIPQDLSGVIPPPTTRKRVKREFEDGMFSAIRNAKSVEPIHVSVLREKVNQLLHPREGSGLCQRAAVYDACMGEEAANAIIISALRTAVHDEAWHELWVLLGQIEAWLVTGVVRLASEEPIEHPWWVRIARAQHAVDPAVQEVVHVRDDAPTVHVRDDAPTMDVQNTGVKLEPSEPNEDVGDDASEAEFDEDYATFLNEIKQPDEPEEELTDDHDDSEFEVEEEEEDTDEDEDEADKEESDALTQLHADNALPVAAVLNGVYPGYITAELSMEDRIRVLLSIDVCTYYRPSEWIIFLSIYWSTGVDAMGTFHSGQASIFHRLADGSGDIVIPPGHKEPYLRGHVSVVNNEFGPRATTYSDARQPAHVWHQGGKFATDDPSEKIWEYIDFVDSLCEFEQAEVEQGAKSGRMTWPRPGLFAAVLLEGQAGQHLFSGVHIYMCRRDDVAECQAAARAGMADLDCVFSSDEDDGEV